MGRGRDKGLIQRRNAKLVERYYYWTELKRLRFDDAVLILSRDEFFISEARVFRVIQEEYDSFRERLAAEPSARHKNSP